MTRQHDAPNTGMSNWTLTTGTSPGEPDVQAAVAMDTVQRRAHEAMTGSRLNVVAVSNDALRPELVDMLLVDGSSYDVIFVESIARAYSRVRELRADLIVLFIEIDDEDACRLLSMLHNDRALHGISVVVCATSPDRTETRRLPDFEERGETRLPAAS